MKRTSQQKSAGGPLERSGKQAEQWDNTLGRAIEQLPQSQLPTTRTVLQRYRSSRTEKPDEPTINLVTIIASEVKLLWDKARIPTLPSNGCNKRVMAAVELWMGGNRRPEKRCAPEYQAKLDQLMDLEPKTSGRGGHDERELEYLKELMRATGKQKKKDYEKKDEDDEDSDWETDYQFYIDQYKGPRQQRIGDIDKKHSQHEEKSKSILAQNEAARSDVSATSVSRISTDDLQAIVSDDSQSSEDDDSQDEYIPEQPATSTPLRDDTINISLSRKHIFKDSAEVAARIGISNRKHVALTAKLIKMGGGNLKGVTLSTSSAWRQRSIGINEGAKGIKMQFETNMPVIIVLHWAWRGGSLL